MVKGPVRFRARRMRKAKGKKGLGKKAVMKIAKKVVSMETEKKDIRGTLTNIAPVQAENANFDTQSVIDTSVVLRNIPNGNTNGARIGERIKLTRFMLHGTVYNKSDVALPVYLKMWVISDRFNPTNGNTGNIEDACRSGLSQPSSSWFANGSSTSGMTGTLNDLNLDLDRNRWRLFKTKLFKISTSNPTGYHNNDFKLSQRFSIDLLKYHPKIVRYMDALSNTWFTRKVYIVFQPVTLDNIQDPTRGLVNVSYAINVRYTDN